MSKILTISVAAYNVERYINQTLDSLVVSTILDKLEVIVVNDGSKDNTAKIVEEYVKKYPNTFILLNKKNGGYGSTINESIKIATGKYYKLLDGDDWFDKKELPQFIKKLEKLEADIVFSKYSIFYENKNKVHIIEENKCYEENVKSSTIEEFSMHGFCVKTIILKNPLLSIHEHCFYTDIEFCMKALERAYTAIAVPINVYCYRIGREGQSVSVSSLINHIENHELVTKTVLELAYNSENLIGARKKACNMVGGHLAHLVLPDVNKKNKTRFMEFCYWLRKDYSFIEKELRGYAKLLYKYPNVMYYVFYFLKRLKYKLNGSL